MLLCLVLTVFFFFSSRRRHTRFDCDWSSDVCSSDLSAATATVAVAALGPAAAIGRGAPVGGRGLVAAGERGAGEGRVGEEGRARGGPYLLKKKKRWRCGSDRLEEGALECLGWVCLAG